jgi:aldose 1-epimerase
MDASARFAVERARDPVFGVDAYLLRDHHSGSLARVLPPLGNSLMSFAAGLPGRRQEVLLSPAPEERAPRPTHFGVPLLFPFPNRIRRGVFKFQGHTYHMDITTPEGHHSHGLVRDRPWRVTLAAATPRGAVLRSVFEGERHGDVMRQYPFPFLLTVTYTLADDSLQLEAVAKNTGSRPMPMGFGIHPYFRLPLAEGGRPGVCQVQVPARRLWVLDADKLPLPRTEAVPPDLDFRTLRDLGEAELDHLYADLGRENGVATCRLRDPQARAEVSVSFGPEFPFVVLFAPAERPTICFEPYSCLTDAPNLTDAGQESGLVVLKPGATWQGRVLFRVRDTVETA